MFRVVALFADQLMHLTNGSLESSDREKTRVSISQRSCLSKKDKEIYQYPLWNRNRIKNTIY
jgi:hypothetical protein